LSEVRFTHGSDDDVHRAAEETHDEGEDVPRLEMAGQGARNPARRHDDARVRS
jgi:hypothetical protein